MDVKKRLEMTLELVKKQVLSSVPRVETNDKSSQSGSHYYRNIFNSIMFRGPTFYSSKIYMSMTGKQLEAYKVCSLMQETLGEELTLIKTKFQNVY
ncbi:unnamed protein product [Arabis nemorensis]|uniref:Uncharacterized protein n=1 Tax=Arabis nemorensis TaxID=586526 RepID=A0A565AQQ9_9BRAS|nr:unnamed protein product [Arabis nemorensis]